LYDNTQQLAHIHSFKRPSVTTTRIKNLYNSTISLDKGGCKIKKPSCMMSINNAAPSFTPHKNNEWEKTQ
jgi:hypothetical protein